MSYDNAALARRWFEELWNERRGAAIEERIAPQAVCYGEGGELHGPDDFRTRVYQPFVDAFPDLHVSVEGTISEGDQVVVRWTATGKHTGEGLGLPATGRSIHIRGLTWIRFENGKFVEGWDCWNQREMIESLK